MSGLVGRLMCVYLGTNTAALMPKSLPNFPANVALILRLPARIAERLLWGTML